MPSLDLDLRDAGCKEIFECYDISMPADPEARNPIHILERMTDLFGSIRNISRLIVIPSRLVPDSEASRRNLPFAIYSAPSERMHNPTYG